MINTAASTWRVVCEAWALPTADGLMAGVGAEVRFRIKSRPGVHALYLATRASLMERPKTLDDLTASVSQFPPAVVRDVLMQFVRLGLVTEDLAGSVMGAEERDALLAHPLYNYFSARSPSPWLHAQRIAACRVGLVAGADLATPLALAIGQQGFGKLTVLPLPTQGLLAPGSVTELFEKTDFVIAAAADVAQRVQMFPIVNNVAIRTGKAWLGGHVERDTAVVGPLFIPAETACYNCLELREDNHLPNLADYRQFRALLRETPMTLPSAAAPFVTAFLVQALVSESVGWCARLSLPATYQTLVETNLSTLETTRHSLLKVPLCNVCGPHVEQPYRRTWSL